MTFCSFDEPLLFKRVGQRTQSEGQRRRAQYVPQVAGGDCFQADLRLQTETLRWGRRQQKEWNLNTPPLSSTDECRLSVSLSIKSCGPRLKTIVLLFHLAPSEFLETDEEEVAVVKEAFVHCVHKDASICGTNSGGNDEDATLFCGECCVDPEWD